MGNSSEVPFSRIVYSQTQDEFPELMKYVTGFHMIDEKDDGNKAIGVEMFRINDRPYLLAAIFKYGFLKPLVLLLDVTNKQIKALTKKVAGLIQKDSIKVNADLIPDGEDRGMYSRPDFYNMFRPPKIGSLNRPDKDWDPIFFKTATKKEAEFIKTTPGLEDKVKSTFGDAMESLKGGLVKPVSVKVRVVTKPRTKEERVRFLEDDTPIIEDFRSQDETSEVADLKDLKVELTRLYQNPTTPGFYNVLTNTGDWKKMIFILKDDMGLSKEYVLYDPETRHSYENVDPSQVFTKECLDTKIDLKEPPVDGIGQGFLVDPKMWELKKGSCVWIPRIDASESGNFIVYDLGYKKVVIDKRMNSGTIDTKGEIVTMGKDTKWLPVWEVHYKPINLGDVHTVLRTLMLQKPEIKILNNDSGVLTVKDAYGKTKEVSKVALLREYNVSAGDLKEVMSKKTGSYLLKKKAFAESPQEYPILEYNTEQLPFIPDYYDGSVVTPQESLGAAVQPTDPGDLNLSSPSQGISNEALIQSAMSAESPIVVDASLFGVLANSAASTERIKQLTPLMNNMIHQLGVLYMDICWHTEDFSDDYTSEELYDLEDSILTTFKALQDICIYLTQRKRIYGPES